MKLLKSSYRTLILTLFVVLVIPLTLLATSQRVELRKKAIEPGLPSSSSGVNNQKYVPGEVLVKFKRDPRISALGKPAFPTINKILEEFEKPSLSKVTLNKEARNAKIKAAKEKFGLDRIYKITLSKDQLQNLKEQYSSKAPLDYPSLYPAQEINDLDITKLLIQELLQDPNVEYAELNGFYHKTDIFPDDTLFSQQWSLNNTGQTGGTYDADIDAPEAWQETTGSSQVIIAVLDSGVKYDHEDLGGNILKDNDGNVIGFDFVNNTVDPMDEISHGTHVAGIIATVSNNSLGVSGLCWSCKIMPIKFIGNDGLGSTDHAVLGIQFAMENGARVINNSWGGGPYSQALQDTINAAVEVGILVIASSGNDNIDMKDFYPAAMENVISVGSTNKNDHKSWFSNYGLSLDLSAPGEEILSTFIPGYILAPGCQDEDGDGYGVCGGTSMAGPHVAGIAALILSQNPEMSLDDLKRKLFFGVDDKGDTGWDKYFGLGRVNAEKAVRTPPILEMQAVITDPPENKVISYRSIPIKGYAFAYNFSAFKVEVGISEEPTSWQTTGITLVNGGTREVFGDKLADFDPQALPYGLLTLKLTVYDQSGATAESRTTVNYMPERIVYVDDDNTSGIEDGTEEHPFNTIQEGLDDANPLDTVRVLSGIYKESVLITKNEVVLSGENPFTTIISGLGVENSAGIRAYAPDILTDFFIENFTINGFQRGIIISGPAKNGEIRGNIVKDIPVYNDIGYGIQLDHFCTNIKVTGNFVIGGRYGIFQNGFQNNGNSFEFNYVTDSSFAGLYIIHWGRNLLIRDNVFVGNQVVGIGISGEFPNSIIEQNHLEANDYGFFPGFFSAESNAFIIRNNLTNNVVSPVFIPPDAESLIWSKDGKGNYWSTYDELEEGAVDENNDGIADSPYQIDENNVDEFPLMKENGWLVSDFRVQPDKAFPGLLIMISGGEFGAFQEGNKVILNYGHVNEKELSIEYWDNERIVARLPQKIMPGRYYLFLLIKGQDGNLPIEINTILTVFHDSGLVCIPESLLLGDLNCDCKVNMIDIMMVASIWHTQEGDERFNPEFDFDDDGRITVADIMYVCAKWGNRCSD